MNRVEEWIIQNKSKIEKGLEIMGQSCEVLAATVGQLHPILEAVFVASAEILNNPEGKETKYLVEQFDKVNQKLVDIQVQIDKIGLEMQRATMNKQNFDREVHIISQYEKFVEFVNAKPNFKEPKMKKFLSQYENTDGDLNLDALYNEVIGNSISGKPMLDTVVETEERSRRAVEVFCARLKKLFVLGIIAIMAHAALKDKLVGEDMVKKWQGRMEEVEKLMKAAVEDCIDNFADQAKVDIKNYLQDKGGSVNSSFTQSLLEILAKKYDWISWSVRVFNPKGFVVWNWLAGNNFEGRGGGHFFDTSTKNNIKVVISFSVDPKPINKSMIQDTIERQKLKGNMMNVAQSLYKSLPNCLVHAISTYKEVEETNNFQDECYYYEKKKGAYLCIHSD